jgi:GGDEF domain-containing protein
MAPSSRKLTSRLWSAMRRPWRRPRHGPQSHASPAEPTPEESPNERVIVNVAHIVDGRGPARKGACLVVVHGGGLGGLGEIGWRYSLEKTEVTIGSAAMNDIRVDQEGVSATHAIITFDDRGVRIASHEPTRATWINDRKLDQETPLADQDRISVGRSIFTLHISDDIDGRYHEEIYRLSTVDGLTQVFNRGYFTEVLGREIPRARRYQRPLALMMLGIDGLERCSDTLGYRASDHALRQVAELIRNRSRKVDLVARYGSEWLGVTLPEVELHDAAAFGVILPERDLHAAAGFAETLREAIEQTRFVFEDHHIPLTISVGVAELEPHITTADALIQISDARLHRAQSLGRNRVVSSADEGEDIDPSESNRQA